MATFEYLPTVVDDEPGPLRLQIADILSILVLRKLSYYSHADAKGERKYSFYSFLTSTLDGGEWSASCPGRALSPGKDPQYPLYRRLGGPQSWFGHRG
jgi:hypothetical protein